MATLAPHQVEFIVMILLSGKTSVIGKRVHGHVHEYSRSGTVQGLEGVITSGVVDCCVVSRHSWSELRLPIRPVDISL